MNFRKCQGLLAKIIVGLFVLGVFFWFDHQYAVPVLMYHNVEPNSAGRNNTVSLASFQKHLDYLKKNNYQVVALDEICDAMASRKRLPRKTVVITFDDGNENNFTNAFPALVQHGMIATFFVPAGQVSYPGCMSWEQLTLMLNKGMHIGSHGVFHSYLPEVPREQQRYEIEESKKSLTAQLKARIDYFSYPVGGLTKEVKEIVQQAGYKAAVTTNRGVSNRRNDLYEIRRIKMSDRDIYDLVLWAKLNGYYNLFRPIKNPY